MSRLENESPIVKLKTLRTIKHILLKGHVTVKRDLMGRVASIRPSLRMSILLLYKIIFIIIFIILLQLLINLNCHFRC